MENNNAPAQRQYAAVAESNHYLVIWRKSETEQRAGRYYNTTAYLWKRTITSSIVWSAWEEVSKKTIDARGFEFRLILGK